MSARSVNVEVPVTSAWDTAAVKRPRRAITLRSVTVALTGVPCTGTSPAKASGALPAATRTAGRASIASDSSPSSMLRIRSTPGNRENGPALVTSAVLTRQSKSLKEAPAGEAATSRVTPPPFFQGTARRSRCRQELRAAAVGRHNVQGSGTQKLPSALCGTPASIS